MKARIAVIASMAALLIGMTTTTAGAARPARSGGLSGIVYSHTDEALAGATVSAWALPSQQQGCPELALGNGAWTQAGKAATSAADGTFSLALSPGYYRLLTVPADLSADSFGYWLGGGGEGFVPHVTSYLGYADDILVPGNGVTGLQVHLVEAASISGTVQDSDGALPGVRVEAFPGTNYYYAPQGYIPTAVTGLDGSYKIQGLPRYAPDPLPNDLDVGFPNQATTYTVTFKDPAGLHANGIDPPHFTIPWVDVSSGGPDHPGVDAALTKSSRLTGVVVNDRGRPLKNIKVELIQAFPNPPVLTDSKGRFTLGLPGFSPGEGAVLAFTDPAGVYQAVFYPGAEYMVTATLLNGMVGDTLTDQAIRQTLVGGAATVKGSAWYTAGVPAAGVQVVAVATGKGWYDWGYTSHAGAVTNCDGSFTLTGLSPLDAHTLLFAPPMMDTNPTQTVGLDRFSGVTTLGQVTMPSWVVEGRISSPDAWTGDPPRGLGGVLASVTSVNVGGGPGSFDWGVDGYPFGTALTDSNGQFRVWMPFMQGDQDLRLAFTDPAGFYQSQWYDGRLYPGDLALAQDVSDYDPWNSSGSTTVQATLWMAP